MYASLAQQVVASGDGFRTSQTIGSTGWVLSLAVTNAGTLLVAPEMSDDGFVAKLSPAGELIWATYLGGNNSDIIRSVAVDARGDIYVAGQSMSTDLAFDTDLIPVQFPHMLQGTAFIAKLSSDGTRMYFTTRIAEVSVISDLVVDSRGAAYITGTSTGGHPTTTGVVQPGFNGRTCSFILPCNVPAKAPDQREASVPQIPIPPATNAFATKLTPDGKSLEWSTYLGQQYDNGAALALDTKGNVVIAGSKIWKLDPAAVTLSLTIPHPGIQDLVLDENDNMFVTGWSGSPTYSGLHGDRAYSANLDSFVVKYTPGGITEFVKYLGGEQTDHALSIAVDAGGNVTVGGTTGSHSFPTVGPLQTSFSRQTSFIAQLNPEGSQLTYSTYVGDSRPFNVGSLARDLSGGVIFAGHTLTPQAANYPVTYAVEWESDVFVARVMAAPAAPRLDAVENLASLEGGPIAPGELIAIRGQGFGPAATVTMDGRALKTLLRSEAQIIAVMPENAPVDGAREFIVEVDNARSNPVLVRSAPFAPAIFTQDRSGRGAGLIFNEDGTLNSSENPAAKGSVITIVGNGIGVLQPVNGSVVAAKPVNVFIGGWFALGVDARVQDVPGLPLPVYVIKVFVPDPKTEHAPDYKLPPIVAVNLEMDGIFSQSSVALALK